MGRQIQRCIDGIDPTPVGMGIGGPVDPDFSKDGQIGRNFRLRPLIRNLGGFTSRWNLVIYLVRDE